MHWESPTPENHAEGYLVLDFPIYPGWCDVAVRVGADFGAGRRDPA